jgi:hypothetical protein
MMKNNQSMNIVRAKRPNIAPIQQSRTHGRIVYSNFQEKTHITPAPDASDWQMPIWFWVFLNRPHLELLRGKRGSPLFPVSHSQWWVQAQAPGSQGFKEFLSKRLPSYPSLWQIDLSRKNSDERLERFSLKHVTNRLRSTTSSQGSSTYPNSWTFSKTSEKS